MRLLTWISSNRAGVLPSPLPTNRRETDDPPPQSLIRRLSSISISSSSSDSSDSSEDTELSDWNYDSESGPTAARIKASNARKAGKLPRDSDHDAVREKMKETRHSRASEAWREYWC